MKLFLVVVWSIAAAACVKGSYEQPPVMQPFDGSTATPDTARAIKAQCHPRAVRAVTTSQFEEPHTPVPACTVDDTGAVDMSYMTFAGCPQFIDDGKPSGDYRACYFAQNEDVSQFERGRGLFAVKLCFDGPLFEDLNLWFDTPAPSVPMRLMRLVRGDDPTPRSCRTLFLSLEDSCSSAFDQVTCGAKCSDDAAADGAVADAGDAGVPPTPCAAFERVRVRMTAEYCVCPGNNCVRPPTADVRLTSLVYYPDDCLCTADDDCEAGTFCRKDALSPDASCWKTAAGCRGICAP
jgi:hypothetical protein